MTRQPPSASRRAGMLLPLFSMPSSRSWGIGEIPDLAHMARWLEGAGLHVLQILPINEMPPGETSPYSAMSAMAIDPQYIAVGALEDFAALGGEGGLEPGLRARLEGVRAAPGVDYRGVRELKQIVLRRAFARFCEADLAPRTLRAFAFDLFLSQEAWWLDEYSLFRALHAHFGEQPWSEWPESLRARRPDALAAARHELADEIRYRQYLQWVASEQWFQVLAGDPVALFGDMPFMVGADSADVWSRQHEFRLDASVGVPPDAFSADGQDWRLPVYRWDEIARRDFDWLRDRARRYADLFAGYRIDHVVGFYRTYFRPHDGTDPGFTPADETAQVAQGERALAAFRGAGAEIVAEDLGTVPDFVRASLARLRVPGCKVFRWERRWLEPGQPFVDPADYPLVAVATSGTHDTEPLVTWWAEAPADDRRAVLEIPSVGQRLTAEQRLAAIAEPSLTAPVRHALTEALFASGAGLIILPMQDVFGWDARINRPAIVNEENWTWRLPWPSDRLGSQPEAVGVARQLKAWADRWRTGELERVE